MSCRSYYLEDLAYIHQAGFSAFGKTAGTEIIRILRKRGRTTGRIVELGSGSGAVTQLLTRRGYDVSAVDGSQAMVRLARKSCPKVRFTVGSLWQYHLHPCSAVVAVGECLNYEFHGRNTHRRLHQLFARIYKSLEPGGVFVFDVLVSGIGVRGAGSLGLAEGEDWFVAVERREKGEMIIRRIRSFRRKGSLFRMSIEVHRQRRYRLSRVMALLTSSGFRVRVQAGYGVRPLRKDHKVIIAWK